MIEISLLSDSRPSLFIVAPCDTPTSGEPSSFSRRFLSTLTHAAISLPILESILWSIHNGYEKESFAKFLESRHGCSRSAQGGSHESRGIIQPIRQSPHRRQEARAGRADLSGAEDSHDYRGRNFLSRRSRSDRR